MKLKDNSLFITLDNTTATGSYKLTKKEGFKELNTAYWKYKDYMKAQLKKVALKDISSPVTYALLLEFNRLFQTQMLSIMEY